MSQRFLYLNFISFAHSVSRRRKLFVRFSLQQIDKKSPPIKHRKLVQKYSYVVESYFPGLFFFVLIFSIQ